MKNVSLWFSTAALALCAGSAHAQISQLNSCEAHVGAVTEGAHAAGIVAASATPVDGVFWPPNHKLRTVVISAENDDGDACNVTINDVRQDEALDGEGDGNTSPDSANCSNAGNDSRVDLRGERSGLGTGRYYHITYTMDDPDAPMQPKMGEAKLLVPHDQGVAHLGTYVDEGPLFPSYSGATLSCSN